MKQASPLLLVDLLKVTAALVIILHHLSNYGQIAVDARLVLPNLLMFLSEYGRFAVQLFLVMAGYLAALSLTRRTRSIHSQEALRLIFNRYLRLFAPYTVALIVTIFCAWVARFWVNDEFVGETETLAQFVAHLFFLQGILGLDSISAGVWYVAIDWQLYSVLAIALMVFSSYQALIWLLSILAVSSLLFFNRSGAYEAYFIYFFGPYGLGVLAYLARNFSDTNVRALAQWMLIALGLTIALSSFHEIWPRNWLAWFVAALLCVWGNTTYSLGTAAGGLKNRLLRMLAWGSQRSYCAFLIHFAFILLANTLYIALGFDSDQSGGIAISLMLLVIGSSVIAANYLYRWVEVPSTRLTI